MAVRAYGTKATAANALRMRKATIQRPWPVSSNRLCGGPSRHRADTRGTAPSHDVLVDLVAEVSDDGPDGGGDDLAETADRGEHYRLRQLVDEGQVLATPSAAGHVREDVDHLGRPDPAGDALPARLVLEELHRVQRHVEHAGAFGADDDGSRSQHGARLAQRLELERRVDHGGRQVARRRAGWRPGLQGLAAQHAARAVEQFAGRRSQGDFVDARPGDV